MRRAARVLARLSAQLALVLLLGEGALHLLAPRVPQLAPLLYLPSLRTDFDAIADLPSLAALLEIESRAVQLCLLENRHWYEERLREVVAILERLQGEVRLAGDDFLVAILPDQVQLDDAFRERGLAHLGEPPGQLVPGCPHEPLATRLAERGIEHLDLLPAFRGKAGEGPLYWPGNNHWNVAGNALAAQELARFVGGRIR